MFPIPKYMEPSEAVKAVENGWTVWNRNGEDHVVPLNESVSLEEAVKRARSAGFVVSDDGRYFGRLPLGARVGS